MACAFRVTRAPGRPTSIVSTGPFGERVSRLLTASMNDCWQWKASEIAAAFAVGADAAVFALWRPDQELCEAADELSFRTGTPWLPVIMEHPVIWVGPMVCPPDGPCFRCYARRRAQHQRERWAAASLDAAYGGDPECGPGGYLPHHARMASALAREMLGRMTGRNGCLAAGEVVTIRLIASGLNTSRVIACHGCNRCGAGTSLRPGWLGDLAARACADGRHSSTPGSPGGSQDHPLAPR